MVQTAPETHEEQDSVTKSFMVANVEGIAYSSLHEINETANASNWGKICPTLLRTLTELCAMPIGVCCCIYVVQKQRVDAFSVVLPYTTA